MIGLSGCGNAPTTNIRAATFENLESIRNERKGVIETLLQKISGKIEQARYDQSLAVYFLTF
jgi:hypothetical protein